MKYYIIAGETSGDLHGSNLMKHIKIQDLKAEFRFWGGDLMLKESLNIVKHYKETAFMGISDVLLNINTVFKNIDICKKDILEFNPDAVILIDYPGFNLRIAKFAKQNNFKVHYYISPKVWAWNTKRAYKIKKNVDYLYSILPFEVDFYKDFGVKPDYIGNPLCDAIETYPFESNFKENYQLKKPMIALLPGSRKSELRHILPAMVSVVEGFPDYEFVLAGAHHLSDEMYAELTQNKVRIIKGKTYDILKNAHAALVCSGTATLETALLGCPQVVCYKFSKLSYFVGRLVIKIKYISLVNLILDKPAVKELIQNELTKTNLYNELKSILQGKKRQAMFDDYDKLNTIVGKAGASERAAKLIVDRITKG